jgi:predicted nucleic acid-binding protein
MIVVDASALLELMVRGPAAAIVERRLSGGGGTLHAPHLIDVEVASALRRLTRTREIDADRALQALEDLLELRLVRYPHHPLLLRIWELRHTVSAYDAAYVSLAESLGATLVTRDSSLAAARGHRARIDLV